MSPRLRAAGRRRYVSLTTFRRTGVGVATPVWVAVSGDAVVVVTGRSTGKVKRLRRDARVELRECSASGRVREGAPVVRGSVELLEDPRQQQGPLAALAAKYGIQYRLVTLVERVLERGDHPDRIVLRITDA